MFISLYLKMPIKILYTTTVLDILCLGCSQLAGFCWNHWLDGRESEWTLGVGDGQGGLACSDSWGLKESDMTERLNWTEEVNITKKCFCRRLTRTYPCNPWRLRGKETTYKEGDLGSVLELGRSPGGGHGNPLQYSFFFNWRLIILQYCDGFVI